MGTHKKRLAASNEYPQDMFLLRNKKTIDTFWLKKSALSNFNDLNTDDSFTIANLNFAGLGGADGCTSNWRPGGHGFNPRRGRQHSFVEIDHEILSTVILSLPLIQEGQLSVCGERMCTVLVNPLED